MVSRYHPAPPFIYCENLSNYHPCIWEQVESLGGRWSGERHHYDEGIVMVMHDPEEHEFCIVQYYR